MNLILFFLFCIQTFPQLIVTAAAHETYLKRENKTSSCMNSKKAAFSLKPVETEKCGYYVNVLSEKSGSAEEDMLQIC